MGQHTYRRNKSTCNSERFHHKTPKYWIAWEKVGFYLWVDLPNLVRPQFYIKQNWRKCMEIGPFFYPLEIMLAQIRSTFILKIWFVMLWSVKMFFLYLYTKLFFLGRFIWSTNGNDHPDLLKLKENYILVHVYISFIENNKGMFLTFWQLSSALLFV